ncbi:MAG: hypothetical protein HY457_03285 [Parcubacteria group bacterium]|nr:hypothetical protein [Parcubacteria group bacterium]
MHKHVLTFIVVAIALVTATIFFGGSSPLSLLGVSKSLGTVQEATDFSSEEITLSVLDQAPGGAVVVEHTTLPSGGYVAIHEDAEGVPGTIIGKSAYLSQGEINGLAVTLERPSVAGEVLYAVLLSDNGDQVLAPEADAPMIDQAGNVIFSVFNVIGE